MWKYTKKKSQMKEEPYIKFKNIFIIPTFHSRIEFAKLVRTALFKVFPDVIAVELPNNFFFKWNQIVKEWKFENYF